jgi:ATP-dependent exoDNAse (exonuclease V) alpha subunit
MLNGTRGVVVGIDEPRGLLDITTSDGAQRSVPFAYGEAGNLAHGYAMTIHKAQGATTDHALVLVDSTISREALYTAMSRGRGANDLYVETDTGRDDVAHVLEIRRDPVDLLVAAIERTAAQEMAIDHGRSIEG